MAIARETRRVRYAVVGAGNIAQIAVLPAFEHASESSELVAIVSGTEEKREELGRRFGVQRLASYEDYDDLVRSGDIDAVYITLPNTMHRDYAERAARAGVHVLCEKPMAMTEEDCEAMIRAADQGGVKLMIAYRLHFEQANLEAIEIARSGTIGEPRSFSSVFTQEVRPGDIRTRADMGGGALFDLGVYCVNAARYLFRAEPEEVLAATVMRRDDRFHDVDETVAALLRFPGNRLAQFTASQGLSSVSTYRLTGTLGDLRVEPAYEYSTDLVHHLCCDGETTTRLFPCRDQFAPELVYFSRCILENLDPEPSGAEGLADVRVLRAILASAASGRAVHLPTFERARRPDMSQEIRRPKVPEQHPVGAPPPTIH
ncbi:MAG: Gfo/Idh/MocA family oxidoreductase [Polyangiaceae bacterium]|nr:Gfo/Idh/MocA family oxidoreductase [Polyangiaceae bacterium]